MSVAITQPGEARAFRSTLNLTALQIEAILADMELDGRRDTGRTRRTDARASYRPDAPLELTVTHPGGGKGRFLVHPYDLSRSGIGFLHGGFLYEGSPCNIALRPRNPLAAIRDVAARVVWCRHCASTCHAVGLHFDAPIDMKPFVDGDQFAATLGQTHLAAPESLIGRLVALEEQAIDGDMLRMALADTGLQATVVTTLDEALAILRKEAVDLVLCELNLTGIRGEDAIAKMRDAGYQRPIVVVTAAQDSSRLAAANRNGASEVVRKPYAPELLLRMVANLFSSMAITVSREPLRTSLPSDLAAKRRVPEYIARVDAAANDLDRAIDTEDSVLARQLSQTLRVSAEAYGFSLLAEAARVALGALDATQAVSECRDDLRRLVSVARRLDAGLAVV